MAVASSGVLAFLYACRRSSSRRSLRKKRKHSRGKAVDITIIWTYSCFSQALSKKTDTEISCNCYQRLIGCCQTQETFFFFFTAKDQFLLVISQSLTQSALPFKFLKETYLKWTPGGAAFTSVPADSNDRGHIILFSENDPVFLYFWYHTEQRAIGFPVVYSLKQFSVGCRGCNLLVLYYLPIGLDASSPLRGISVSWHQALHHLPFLLLFDQILGNTPPPTFPSGQVLTPIQTDSKYVLVQQHFELPVILLGHS